MCIRPHILLLIIVKKLELYLTAKMWESHALKHKGQASFVFKFSHKTAVKYLLTITEATGAQTLIFPRI